MNPLSLIVYFSLLDPQVTALVQKMDSDDFQVRDAASAELMKMGERPITILKVMQHNEGSAEVRRRSRMLVERFYNSIRPSLDVDVFPQIDMLPDWYPDKMKIVGIYMSRYPTGVVDGDWHGYRAATQEFVRTLYDKGESHKEVVKLLDKMVKQEREWWKKGTYNQPNFRKPRGY